jgi:monomeric isocitrate dehydrogenase
LGRSPISKKIRCGFESDFHLIAAGIKNNEGKINTELGLLVHGKITRNSGYYQPNPDLTSATILAQH